MDKYAFNLPPINQLTISQQSALNNPTEIAVSGGPGTGKSVVSMWRHINKSINGEKSLLLTYTTTLQHYLKRCCMEQNRKAAINVRTSLGGKPSGRESWDEIIVDEAQDLPEEYYEDLKNICSSVSYGADDAQILYPEHCCTEEDLRRLFNNNEFILNHNYRNTRQILEFVKDAFTEALITQSMIEKTKNTGNKPKLLYSIDEDERNEAIVDIINEYQVVGYNIAILVPWKKDVNYYSELLDDNDISHSAYYEGKNGMNGCEEIGNVHITPFKSAKGLEFDLVIIPNFEKCYDDWLMSHSDRYHITWNDYFVGCTRCRSNLFLISDQILPISDSVVDFVNL